jgi:acyl carrier protein
VAREDKGDKYLCAYIVKGDDFNQEEVRAFITANLPVYMIPTYFVALDKMPLTTNGKINRKILPIPEIKAGEDYVAPRNETDEKLAVIWSEVLNIPKEEISITSNFFNIGGHSLKATILLNKLFEETGFELKLSDFFNIATIKEISDIFLLVNEEQEEDNYNEISI